MATIGANNLEAKGVSSENVNDSKNKQSYNPYTVSIESNELADFCIRASLS